MTPQTTPQTKITKRCRLLCPECRELKRVAAVAFDEAGVTVARLICNHSRGELLALTAPGRISIENYAGRVKVVNA